MPGLKPKISIIGCGNVGIRCAYALVIKGIVREIILVDLDRNRAEGEAMDLNHGAPYVRPVEIAAGDYPDIQGSDIVVITAGAKQKPGQSRTDLVKQNVALYRKIIPEIMEYSPGSVLLVVSNPVDILAYAAYKISGKPHREVISSGTVLDSARLRFLLSRHCNVDARNIHAYILGEHGDSEFAVWSKAMIGGMYFKEYCPICEKRDCCDRDNELNGIFSEVRDSAYKIIEKKGETSYGIGLALVKIIQSVVNDTRSILPVSTLVEDYYGVNDVYMGLPSVVGSGGIKEVLKIGLDEEEQSLFKKSAGTLKKVIKDCGI
ncbi:MAG: L-lactate dehydrogenase [Candidatus Aureabacteria bacterium]|nr:L-lactate dehydrogenase [Candidatus Auribacterota bacterium]